MLQLSQGAQQPANTEGRRCAGRAQEGTTVLENTAFFLRWIGKQVPFPATHFPSSPRISLRSFTLAVVTFPAKRFSVSETCENQSHRETDHLDDKAMSKHTCACVGGRVGQCTCPAVDGGRILQAAPTQGFSNTGPFKPPFALRG